MTNASVLIIEDDEVLRDIYAAKFSLEGFEVRTAIDGQDGLEKARQSEPNIILLDMIMPRLTGFDFLRAYQPATRHPRVKTIILSNKSTQQDIRTARSMGVHDYLIKSQHTPQDLTTLVRAHLDQA